MNNRNLKSIRNFVVISHIDHGKSTLADRFLELTGTVEKRKMKEQLLDQMELERERGITIKLQPVRMEYILKFPMVRLRSPQVSNPSASSEPALSLTKGQVFQFPNKFQNSNKFTLNLIDTPGHVDFTYEVSRSLAAVEGAILLVDATQGIQAQTLANYYLAREQGLTIIPAVNKIDLPNAKVEESVNELAHLLNCRREEVLRVSAKTGQGVTELLEEVVRKVPAPPNTPGLDVQDKVEKSGSPSAPPLPHLRDRGCSGQGLAALIFDSVYDDYRGVVAYVRLFDGQVKAGDKIYFIGTKKMSEVLEVGYFKPSLIKSEKLEDGEIGYIVTGLKDLSACKVGDTVINSVETRHALSLQLAGYKEIKPMVFAGFFCSEGVEPKDLRQGLEKIKLTDASLFFEPESSPALGPGFRCGFLGLLHLEIIQERLKREYGLDLVVTAPSVAYKIKIKNQKLVPSEAEGSKIKNIGQEVKAENHILLEMCEDEDGKAIIIHSPQELPNLNEVEEIQEPWVRVDVITPANYLGGIMQLTREKRGIYLNTDYLSEERLILHYELPLHSILTDFYDKLKSVSSGYASLNYDLIGYRSCEVERLDILVADELAEPLAMIVYKDEAYRVARKVVEALKDVLPRQMFEVKIQAVLGYQKSGRGQGGLSTKLKAASSKSRGGKIIAAARIPPMRKDVTAKLYGGDVTRKMKLLEKQKKGKKKMRQLGAGRVSIPSEAYLAVLKR